MWLAKFVDSVVYLGRALSSRSFSFSPPPKASLCYTNTILLYAMVKGHPYHLEMKVRVYIGFACTRKKMFVCNRGTQFCVTAGSTLIYILIQSRVLGQSPLYCVGRARHHEQKKIFEEIFIRKRFPNFQFDVV